jgi:hypothetical protein
MSFPDDGSPSTDGTYRSVFGPCAPHNGIILANSDREFRLGVHKRTLGVRGNRVAEKEYRHNQAAFIVSNPLLTQLILEHIEEHKELHDYLDLLTAAIKHHGDPHQKRVPRIQAMIESMESGEFACYLWLRRILLKAKKNEWAKVHKPLRGIGDLGILASLQGFVVTKIMKNALTKSTIRFHGGSCKYVNRPATTELREVFRQLITPEDRFYFAYFSDDSVLSVRTADGTVRRFNIDIKSCDCSHTHYLFQMLVEVTPEPLKKAMKVLIDQLRLPFEIVSTQDKTHKVRFQPHTAKLQSGSTITTLINNIACLLIIYAISKEKDITSDTIKSAAKKCGYLLTVDSCTDYSQLQFLKHSPVYDTKGRLQPVLNLGVLMRSLGTCKGDLPGRGDIEERARRFNGGLLQGMYPRTSFLLLERLKANTSHPDQCVIDHMAQMLKYKVQHDDEESFSVSTAEIYRRYTFPFEGPPLRPDEFTELDYDFGRLTTWMHYASPATDKIFRQDYGLRARYHRTEPRTAL